MEVFEIHPQAGTRRRLQVHATQEGRPRRLHHRARRRLPHRQADGGHHRVGGRILLGKSCRRSSAGDAGGGLPGLLGRQPGAIRLPQADGPGRSQEAPNPGTQPGHLPGGETHFRYGRVGQGHPGDHPHPERRGHRQPHRKALVQERRPHHPAQRDLYRHSDLGRFGEAQGRAGARGASLPRHRHQVPVPQGQQADELPRPQEGPSPAGGKFLSAQRVGQVQDLRTGHVGPGLQERPVRLLRLPVPDEAGQRGLRLSPAERPPLRGDGG